VASPASEPIALEISGGIPIGAVEDLLRTDHFLQVTVTNLSDRPVGVNSLGVELSDGRWTPGIDQLPANEYVRLPGILRPQEQATVWWDYKAFQAMLDEQHLEIRAIVAHLRGGSKVRRAVPDGWRNLK